MHSNSFWLLGRDNQWKGTHSSTYIRVYNYGRGKLEYVLVSTVEKIKTNSLGLLKSEGTQEIL